MIATVYTVISDELGTHMAQQTAYLDGRDAEANMLDDIQSHIGAMISQQEKDEAILQAHTQSGYVLDEPGKPVIQYFLRAARVQPAGASNAQMVALGNVDIYLQERIASLVFDHGWLDPEDRPYEDVCTVIGRIVYQMLFIDSDPIDGHLVGTLYDSDLPEFYPNCPRCGTPDPEIQDNMAYCHKCGWMRPVSPLPEMEED